MYSYSYLFFIKYLTCKKLEVYTGPWKKITRNFLDKKTTFVVGLSVHTFHFCNNREELKLFLF